MGEEIFLMNSDGSDITQLTQSANQVMVRWPSWRPVPLSASMVGVLTTQWGAIKTTR